MRSPKDSNIPFSDMKYTTENECKDFSIGTCVNLFGLKILNSTEKLVSLNPLYNHQTGSLFPSTYPPCNNPDNLIIKQITVMLYIIILVVSLLFCYLCVKSLVLEAIFFFPSLRSFLSFSFLRYFFVFTPTRKWGIFFTAVDSPYVCIQVLPL